MAVPNTTQGANTYLAPCPVIQPFLTITAISNADPCVVTVSETNSYVAGQIVYFSVPPTYGMYQINGLSGEIISISGQDFTIDIDTTTFSAFSIPVGNRRRPASLAPAGSRNLYNITTVPFHSAGNYGN